MFILRILKNQYFWLGLTILLGFWLRLYRINYPLADWHSWRQADTAAVTRNFVKEGFNPFLPIYDDFSGVAEHPIPNLLRLRFVEFPIYNIFVYPLYIIFGVAIAYSRLVSIIFSLGSILFLYLIAKKYTDLITAQIAAITFAILPFNVFFSRTTLPEPTFVFFSLGMIYFLDNWLENYKPLWVICGWIFMAVAFLMKPWAVFFYLPILYYALKKGRNFFLKKFIPFSFLALLPFIFWRLWILQQPEGIPASNWLLNGDGIRFHPAFWKWIISERIGGEILGATGLFLFFFGLIIKPKNGKYFLYIWTLSMFLYFIIFATGNVRHNYYQIIFVPVAAVFFAKGFVDLIRGGISFIPRVWTILLALLFYILSFYLSWEQVKGFYQINNPAIVEAGEEADKILPKDAIVVAPYNGDTAFLYQTNRSGWAFESEPVAEMVADFGVTTYISTTYDAKTKWIMKHFNVLEKKDNFVIIDLTKLTTKLDPKSDPEP